MKYNYTIFCDCGAPSLYGRLSAKVKKKGVTPGSSFAERKHDDYSYVEKDEYKKYRINYMKFLHENKGKIDVYSNLDVINNPKLTFENQRILESEGLTPIPVFHLGNDEKWLKKYIENYDYIAIGGIFPNPISVLKPMLDKMFRTYFLDKDGFAQVKTHGFGCTAIELMAAFPWYSVDSATARKLANFGWMANIYYDSKGKLHLSNDRVSSRDIPLTHSSGRTQKSTGGFFPEVAFKGRWEDGHVKELERRAKEYGMTMQDLSDSIMTRVVWNYLVYREALDILVPKKWPWNLFTREIKAGSTEEFIMYFAGILSKAEEMWFWNEVSKIDRVENAKGRLQSYFYRKQLEHIISLKYES